MKDTVTYPLSAITGDEEESRIDQLERELVAARNQRDKAIAKERERCAKVCDEMDEAFITIYGTDYTDFQNDPRYLQMAAEAIRKGE